MTGTILPEQWKTSRRNEVNVNICLREYLANMYVRVQNEHCNWSTDDRLQRLDKAMGPVLHTDNRTERDVVYAETFYSDMLGELARGIGEETLAKLGTASADAARAEVLAAKKGITEKRLQVLAAAQAGEYDEIRYGAINLSRIRKGRETLGSVDALSEEVQQKAEMVRADLRASTEQAELAARVTETANEGVLNNAFR